MALDTTFKEILTGADPDRAFHFDVDPDLAAHNDADPDPQHCLWHCTDLSVILEDEGASLWTPYPMYFH